VTRFVSLKDAYCLYHRLFWTECTMVFLALGTALLGLFWGTIPCLVAWGLLERSHKRYRDLFWSQAVALHNAQDEGEPEIYQFMTKRDREKHARMALATWVPEEEEEGWTDRKR